MKGRTRRNVSVLIFSACLLLAVNAFGDQLRMVNNLRNEGVLVPVSAPNRDDLVLMKYATVTETDQVVRLIAFYDDPKTPRPVDYLEVSDVSDWDSVTYGAVFITVLAEFLGVPIPSSMTLMVSGALAARGHLSLSAIVFSAFAAATLGDSLWFVVGRARGEMFIKGYCKLSLGSRDCVRRTKDLFLRFPRTSLLLGTFVPGLSTFVVPVAGFSGTRYGQFLRFDTGGIFLWVSSMVAIGYGAGEWIQTKMMDPERLKWSALAILVGILACFYAVKLWRLNKFGAAELT